MRIHAVRKSRKDQGNCSKCGIELPKGSSYRWIKFRNSPKRKRCTQHECRFRGSDMTTSDKISDLYSAQEQIEDDLSFLRNLVHTMPPKVIEVSFNKLAEIIEDSISLVEGAADGYEESATNLDEYFPGSAQVDECLEKADNCRNYQTELESAKDTAETTAGEIRSSEWTMSNIESALDEIDNQIQSLEVY